jgi:hypothetical protein
MTIRTIVIPLDLLKRVEKLRRQLGNSQGDELLVRLLRLGLQELQKDAMLPGYREGPWRAVPQTKVKIFG